ncbi:MAG: phosphate uptake regulator PhoU [Halobacteria archaeon]|nr:phosphate uptake regulator PhoU [Halobacteria archaeon]
METRKVQITGGSTYVVSIPKSWARDHGIESGSEIALFPTQSSIILEPVGSEDQLAEGTMDVTGLEGEHLERAVITMYVSGFDIIRFTSETISSEQRQSLREAGQRLAGLEIIEETSETVVFQDLLNSSELSVHRTVSRVRLIAKGMFEDSIDAIVGESDVSPDDIIQRDEDVDRMFAMVSRMFRSSLRNARSEEKLGVSREECFDYHTAARQLERIADHATKISDVSKDVDSLPEEVSSELSEMSEEAMEMVDSALEALLDVDDDDDATRLANEVLDSVPSIDDRSRELDKKVHDLDAQTAQRLGLVIDSIGRTADYGGNIAETALQSAAPR